MTFERLICLVCFATKVRHVDFVSLEVTNSFANASVYSVLHHSLKRKICVHKKIERKKENNTNHTKNNELSMGVHFRV